MLTRRQYIAEGFRRDRFRFAAATVASVCFGLSAHSAWSAAQEDTAKIEAAVQASGSVSEATVDEELVRQRDRERLSALLRAGVSLSWLTTPAIVANRRRKDWERVVGGDAGKTVATLLPPEVRDNPRAFERLFANNLVDSDGRLVKLTREELRARDTVTIAYTAVARNENMPDAPLFGAANVTHGLLEWCRMPASEREQREAVNGRMAGTLDLLDTYVPISAQDGNPTSWQEYLGGLTVRDGRVLGSAVTAASVIYQRQTT